MISRSLQGLIQKKRVDIDDEKGAQISGVAKKIITQGWSEITIMKYNQNRYNNVEKCLYQPLAFLIFHDFPWFFMIFQDLATLSINREFQSPAVQEKKLLTKKSSGPPLRITKQNQLSQFRWTSTKVIPIEKT